MNLDETIDMIRRHEGFRDHVYLDTEGVPTGGYGHAFLVGSYLPGDVSDLLLRNDVQTSIDDYDSLGLDLNPVRKAVLIDMLFNLGRTRLLKFKRFFNALRYGDFERASFEMKDSKWARQVKGRAVELAEMMRTGKASI